ncbi:DUF6276 family protein [Halobaculum sp. MBLA0147]|uniref:DUF6276 family protein n=1 Tax=Halobaculum sp. MBLA0147 TaxID=3079934 RepID=UPI0035245533
MTDCPTCSAGVVTVGVPTDLREYAPDDAAAVGLCPQCLTVTAVDSSSAEDPPRFDRVAPPFPDGEAGVALALLIGKLPSLAVEKPAVRALRERAEAAGGDVVLTLDRLVAASDVEPHFALERKVVQMEQLV